MSIFYLKDSNGNFVPIPTIKGQDGKDYILTEADKVEIANKAVETVTPGIEETMGNLVYIGTEAPTNSETAIWLNPNGSTNDIVRDVKLNGTSIVDNAGKADIPVANAFGKLGLVKLSTAGGVKWSENIGALAIDYANEAYISGRSSGNKPMIPYYLDYAVKVALTDGKGAAYTHAEKAAARERFGDGDMELISSFTTEEDCDMLKITSDINGNAFKIKSYFLSFTLPTAPSDYNQVYFNTGYEGVLSNNNRTYRDGAFTFYSKSYPTWNAVYNFFNNGVPLTFACKSTTWNLGSTPIDGVIKPPFVYGDATLSYIDTVTFKQYTGTGYNCPPVMAGTVIKLFGVRA